MSLFFPSPGYIRALNPAERSGGDKAAAPAAQQLSKIPSSLGSYQASYYQAVDEYGSRSPKKMHQTTDNWRKKKQLHDKGLQ